MQKKFGIVVIAALQGSGHKPQSRPGVSKTSRRRLTVAPPLQASAAA